MAKQSNQSNAAMTALPVETLVDILRRCGAPQATAAAVEADLAAGAPANADGTINLVHYTAWLAKDSQPGKGLKK